MAQFINVSTRSINLSRVSVIEWGNDAAGHTTARVWLHSGDPLTIVGRDAAILSDAVSALEAQSECELEKFFATTDGYTTDDGEDGRQGDEEGTGDARADFVLTGPWSA